MNLDLQQAYINCRYRMHEVKAGANTVFTERYLPHNFHNDIFDARLRLENSEENVLLHLEVETLKEIAVELLSLVLRIPCHGTVTAIDRYYKIKTVDAELWNNDLTPIHIQYNDGQQSWLIKNGANFVAHKITVDKNHFLLELFIDAAGLHPQTSYEHGITRSSSSPLIKPGRKYELNIAIVEASDISYPILNRFPFGHAAAFVITDHCDFDEATNLRQFLHGNDGRGAWLGSGLKLTKGVFTKTSAKAGFRAGTLDDNDYLELAEALHASGNEIAPHAIQQSGQITMAQFHDALDWLQQKFDCRSWIEHGNYLKYSYYMGGKHNEYKLADNLMAHGYTSLWSYYDIPADPFKTLNMFHSGRQGLSSGLSPVVRKIANGKPFQAFHLFRSYITRQHHGQKAVSYLLNLFSAGRSMAMSFAKLKQPRRAMANFLHSLLTGGNKKEISYIPYTPDEIKNLSPVLFSEKATALCQYQRGDLLMFTTQEIVHTSDVYTGTALRLLADERGIHIAHTYILNKLPYINGIFEKTGKLKKEWTDFVTALAAMVAEQEIWNPTLAGLTSYISAVAELDIMYKPREILITNTGGNHLAGLSFAIADSTGNITAYWNGQPAISRYDASVKTLSFWGDVPPHATVSVVW